MSRIAYVNGSYVPLAYARVHVEDRGFQFSDGVYEVFPVYGGRVANMPWHLERLGNSLTGLQLAWPVSPAVIPALLRQMLIRNRITGGGMIYVQITRGVSPRNHVFPSRDLKPTFVITARPLDMTIRDIQAAKGVRVISVTDNRWARRDIKSVSLLPNLLAKQKAMEAGAFEALFVDGQSMVTECAASTFWIVTEEGELWTHPLGPEILPGVTRRAVLTLAREMGLRVEERVFSLEQAIAAREAFLTSATNFVMPIVDIDGHFIADGVPGPVSMRLRRAYIDKL
jgi:D-alanine transaminase